MVIYPHALEILTRPESSVDADGITQRQDPETVNAIPCRAQINGSGSVVNLTGEAAYLYSYLVFMPLGSPKIPKGTKVRVTGEDGETILHLPAKQYAKGQLHSRLWV